LLAAAADDCEHRINPIQRSQNNVRGEGPSPAADRAGYNRR
jgi:hypothetical protein